MLPDKIMLNTHPQRWDDKFGPWVRELVWQNVKNVVKKYFYVKTLERGNVKRTDEFLRNLGRLDDAKCMMQRAELMD